MPKFDVDTALVQKLASLLRETGLGEIEYEANGQRIRVALPGPRGIVEHLAPAATASAAGADADLAPANDASHPGAVLSPMVGTVYLSPTPDDPPFISPGDTVAAGQTLMLVEAMKTFNDVRAHRAGTVTRILVENGQPVEYGELLAVIE